MITPVSSFLHLHINSLLFYLLLFWLLTGALDKPEEAASHRCHEQLHARRVRAWSRCSGRRDWKALLEWLTLKTQAVDVKLLTISDYQHRITNVQIWFLASHWMCSENCDQNYLVEGERSTVHPVTVTAQTVTMCCCTCLLPLRLPLSILVSGESSILSQRHKKAGVFRFGAVDRQWRRRKEGTWRLLQSVQRHPVDVHSIRFVILKYAIVLQFVVIWFFVIFICYETVLSHTLDLTAYKSDI